MPTAAQETRNANAILQKYPINWTGSLSLKNAEVLVQLHYIDGNPALLEKSIVKSAVPTTGTLNNMTVLKIHQRMRLEPTQLEGVHTKMQSPNDYCALLVVPCGHNRESLMEQGARLETAFIQYLNEKAAAGIVNVQADGDDVSI